MFGMSGEHLLILGIVLLIFGPKRLPELGNTMGKAIKNFKDAISGVEEAKFRKLEEDRENAKRLASQNPPSASSPSERMAESGTATVATASAPDQNSSDLKAGQS